LELWTGEGVVATVRAARTTGREVEPEAVVATVAARRAGHYFIRALYYFNTSLKHMHRARFDPTTTTTKPDTHDVY
jgi:hypothetical protein